MATDAASEYPQFLIIYVNPSSRRLHRYSTAYTPDQIEDALLDCAVRYGIASSPRALDNAELEVE